MEFGGQIMGFHLKKFWVWMSGEVDSDYIPLGFVRLIFVTEDAKIKPLWLDLLGCDGEIMRQSFELLVLDRVKVDFGLHPFDQLVAFLS